MSLVPPDYIFYQSAVLPPLAAPAQTWKPTTANINMNMATTATAASVQIQVGSALLVSSIQQLEPDSGSQKSHFALQKAVAATVSGGIVNICRPIIVKHSFSQVWSPHQTTLATTQTT